MRISYKPKRFAQGSQDIIIAANVICAEYEAQGYELTLRQLYYQFVARGLIANSQKEYKRLGGIINDARLAGLLDWDYIVDRTRNVAIPRAWDGPSEFMDDVAKSYYEHRWEGQPYRVEVWVEKEALAGVVERAARGWRVPTFSCRGYTSQSELWGAAQRLKGYIVQGQIPVVIHLGDHDPSGNDMTRDIEDRLNLFMHQDWLNEQMDVEDEDGVTYSYSDIEDHMADHVVETGHDEVGASVGMLPVEVNRIALNMDQILAHAPPPNPAKLKDSRSKRYIAEFGRQSWELDALPPDVLDDLIQDTIQDYLDPTLYREKVEHEKVIRERFDEIAREFAEAESDEEE